MANGIKTQPVRRMMQEELELFLDKAAVHALQRLKTSLLQNLLIGKVRVKANHKS